MRLVDRIAYLGRDLEDAIKAGLIRKGDVPADIVRNLGAENGKIIGCFVNDTIASSLGKDAIEMSEEVFLWMNMLKEFNYHHIYLHPEVDRKSGKTEGIIAILFGELEKILEKSQRGENYGYVSALVREAPLIETFFHFLKNTNYNLTTPSWRMVTDYIAGMTDLFAERTFMQLFMPSSVV